MIKLLSKRAIDEAKARDKQREIEQGKMLAKRVDVLRETVANEETGLTKFRTAAISKIHEDIAVENDRLTLLKVEVEVLEQRKRDALLPLDTAWGTLRVKEAENVAAREVLWQKADVLDRQATEILEKSHEIDVEQGRVTNFKHLAAQELVRASAITADSKRVLKEAQEQAHLLIEEAELRQTGALKREASVAARERDAENRWQKIEKYEVDLMNRELALREGWNTLLASNKG